MIRTLPQATNFFLKIILPVAIIGCLSCNQAANKHESIPQTDTTIPAKPVIDTPQLAVAADTLPVINPIEDKIVDTIFQLAEVKKRADYIEQQTKGARHLKIWIAGTPEDGNKYYWVKAGEDNGFNLVTHFNFYVYPDSMRIMYYDVAEDRELTIKEWEKKEAENNKPR